MNDAFMQVYDEISEGGGFRPEITIAIATDASLWKKTGNPFFMDIALERALQTGTQIVPSLRDHIFEAMSARRAGRATGTWKQVQRHYAKQHAYILICNLRYRGMTISDATIKAAGHMDAESNGEFRWTASTLERQYQDEFVATGREARIQIGWERHHSRKDQDWEEIKSTLPAIPRTFIGSRR